MNNTLEQKKTILAPKLRFKEFNDSWVTTELLNTTSKNEKYGIVDGPFGSNLKTEHYKQEGIPIITSGYVTEGYFYADSYLYVTPQKFEQEKRSAVKPGDIVMAKIGARCGSSAILPSEHPVSILSGNALKITVDKENFSNVFIWQILLHLYRSNKIDPLKTVGAQPAISIANLKKFKLNLPSLPEQEKIAGFLTAVDEKIQQLKHKKQLLERYKKGLMQQLFSGKLRFKDENGKAYPKWEEKEYGSIFSFYSTNSFSRDNLNYDAGNVKNIHYGDIHTKYNTLFDITNETVPYINSSVDLSKIKDENYCKVGDLVIADASEDYKDIGKTIEIVNLKSEKVLAGLHTFLARPLKNKMYVGYSGYLVQSDYVRKQIMTIAQGTKVLSLSTGRLAKVKLNIPSIEEQKKIADFLSAIDAKINGVAEALEATTQFKKGLLQQMFV